MEALHPLTSNYTTKLQQLKQYGARGKTQHTGEWTRKK